MSVMMRGMMLAGLALLAGCATGTGGPAEGPERGLVEVSCLARPDGSLHDCRVEREEPAGEGFGETALRAAAQAKVTPQAAERAGPDSRIRWTMRFDAAR